MNGGGAPITISGEVGGLGAYLNGTPSQVPSAAVLEVGVSPTASALTDASGKFSLMGASSSTILFSIEAHGYFPTFVSAATAQANIDNLQLFAAESAWLDPIAAAYNVDLTQSFACHAAPMGGLNAGDRCIYGMIVGRILDGSMHPMSGVAVSEFDLKVNGGAWYVRGPFFLDGFGMPTQASASMAAADPSSMIGGLYVLFVEIPATTGDPSVRVEVSANHVDWEMPGHKFGPLEVHAFRPYGVTWADLAETQTMPSASTPPPAEAPVSFMRDVRPLLAAPTSEGGTGCYACHVANVSERSAPAGFFMGGTAGELYDALLHQQALDMGMSGETKRVDVLAPEKSLLVNTNLATSVDPHPVKLFPDTTDPRYQMLLRWITAGARDDRSTDDRLNAGAFAVTADGKQLHDDIVGGAIMSRGLATGDTSVLVEVQGLAATSTYAAHVHALPCAMGGGGHYQIDPSVTMPDPTNEIWPTIHTDASGNGIGFVTVHHIARAEAQSVVIHQVGASTRIACADLVQGANVLAVGEFNLLPGGANLQIAGSVALIRGSESGTEVLIRVSGLAGEGPYPAHVHALPCANDAGGGHYKMDPTVMTAMPSNEIWPTVQVRDTGTGIGNVWVPHVARYDARSVVIHDPGTGTKLACADLHLVDVANNPAKASRDLFNFGAFKTTTAGAGLGYAIAGGAGMVRLENGVTTVRVEAMGLDPAKSPYPAHVHALPCAVEGGGGHYKMDPAITAASPANEIWAPLTVAANGAATSSAAVHHYARIDAQSIVIHEPGTLARIACADLSPGGDVTASGTFQALPAGQGLPIAGTAQLRRFAGGTDVTVHFTGLEPSLSHTAHVHALPCAQLAGGGHYKINPEITAVSEPNEIWMHTQADASGGGSSTTHVFQIARPDAISVVLHNPANGDKRSCADLTW
jgi:hypothetical protein